MKKNPAREETHSDSKSDPSVSEEQAGPGVRLHLADGIAPLLGSGAGSERDNTLAVHVRAGEALVHLGAFLHALGDIVLMCAPPPPPEPHAEAKERLVEELREKMRGIDRWMEANGNDPGLPRARQLKRDLESAIADLNGCTPAGERSAREKFAAVRADPVGGRITWVDPTDQLDYSLADELQRLVAWLDLYSEKRAWRTGRHPNYRYHRKMVFDEASGEIQIQESDGTVKLSYPVHQSRRQTPAQKTRIRQLVNELNTKFNNCNYPSFSDLYKLRDLATKA